MNESQGDVETVDITGDAQYILAIDNLWTALIYSSNNSTYELFQNITLSSDTSLRSHGGAITDDHEWVVASIDNQIKVFTFNSSINEFTLNHTVGPLTGMITHISLTNDHLFMAVTTESDYVYVFKYDGSEFSQSQKIKSESLNGERAFLSDDHEYLLTCHDADFASTKYAFVVNYQYNTTSGNF